MMEDDPDYGYYCETDEDNATPVAKPFHIQEKLEIQRQSNGSKEIETVIVNLITCYKPIHNMTFANIPFLHRHTSLRVVLHAKVS